MAVAAASGADLEDRVKEVARTRALQESKAVAEQAIEAALEKKALLPVLLDVSGRATYTDFIGIVSGRSDRQVDAIAEHVVTTLKQRGSQLLSREGNGNGRWTLLDFGDIVVHVFYHPVREFYDIESLWIDAPRVKLKVPPEASQLREEALFYERP
jgi:ribosome-associated protein